MDDLLLFIVGNFSYLYNQYGFRICDSVATRHNGGDSYVILQAHDLKIRITRDKSQFWIDFARDYDRKDDWIPLNIVGGILAGPDFVNVSTLLGQEERGIITVNDVNMIFIKNHIQEIIDIFSKKNIDNTLKIIKQLRAYRKQSI